MGRTARLNPTKEILAERARIFEHALVLDPGSVEAQSRLARLLASRVLDNMTDTAAADIMRAEALIRRALAASPRSPLAHLAKGELLRAQHRYAEAIPEYETVLALDRNSVHSFVALGTCKLFTGSIEEAIPLVERAIRLSPRDPALGVWYQVIGFVHLLQSHTDDAIIWLEKGRHATPAHPATRGLLAAAYALKGQIERAAAELTEARRLSSDDRYSSTARLKDVFRYSGMSKIRALIDATYIVGLRKAGMPEE